jgi:hypothetical protein
MACEMVFINVNILCVTQAKTEPLSTPVWVADIRYLCELIECQLSRLVDEIPQPRPFSPLLPRHSALTFWKQNANHKDRSLNEERFF